MFVNGKKYEVEEVQPETTLLEFIRGVGLTGSKLGCGEVPNNISGVGSGTHAHSHTHTCWFFCSFLGVCAMGPCAQAPGDGGDAT